MRTLDTQKAKEFYDNFGEKQDKQSFYEDTALNTLLKSAQLGSSKSIFEYGCGTGRFASLLLGEKYASKAKYCGIDISEKMVSLAKKKLEGLGDRAEVKVSRGATKLEQGDGSVDRFVSTYVLDLLPEQTIIQIIKEAYRVLELDGLICLASVTNGTGLISKFAMNIWEALFTIKPSIVGGCRPIKLQNYFEDDIWEIEMQKTVVSFGIASEVLVAKKIQTPV